MPHFIRIDEYYKGTTRDEGRLDPSTVARNRQGVARAQRPITLRNWNDVMTCVYNVSWNIQFVIIRAEAIESIQAPPPVRPDCFAAF